MENLAGLAPFIAVRHSEEGIVVCKKFSCEISLALYFLRPCGKDTHP